MKVTTVSEILLLLSFIISSAISRQCLKEPLCYCKTSKGVEIFCKYVQKLDPIDELLKNFSDIYTLRLVGSNLDSIPAPVFSGRKITVLQITAPLSNLTPTAFSKILQLKILNIEGSRFISVPEAVTLGTLKIFEMTKGVLYSIDDEIQHLTSITELILRDNRIEMFSPTALAAARNLQYLDLSHNLLKQLDSKVFSLSSALKTINLSFNNLETLDNSFETINPEVVNLYMNNLTNVDTIFNGEMKSLDLGGNLHLNVANLFLNVALDHLKILRLNDNGLKALDPELLEHLPHLESLYLNNNNLVSIPRDFFSKTHQLSTLELKNNHLTSLEWIQSIKYHYLRRIDLSGNNFTEMIFEDSMKNVEHLDLSDNQIVQIREDFLKNLTHLTFLNFSGNPLQTIEKVSFLNLKRLRTLDMSYSKLSSLNSSLSGMKSVEYLYISDSKLKTIGEADISGMDNLREVLVGNNQLISLEGLENLFNLSSLNVSGNNMKTLKINALPLDKHRLKKLWIADNPWSCDCRLSWMLEIADFIKDDPTCEYPALYNGSSILTLNSSCFDYWTEDCPLACSCKCIIEGNEYFSVSLCSDSNLTAAPDAFPANSRVIDLKDNAIKDLKKFNGKRYQFLQRLYMDSNLLSSLDAVLPQSLRVVSLAANNLSRNPFGTQDISFLANITLSRNPWICDCETWKFREWLVLHKDSISDINGVRCAGSQSLSNRVIIDLNYDDLCHSFKISEINIAIISVVAATTMVVCLLCCLFRMKITALLHSCCDRSEQSQAHVFDAFLLFSEGDEDFAIAMLAEGLETRLMCKLFIPTKDILMRYISSDVKSTASDCCKIIVVLTRQFINDDVCLELLNSVYSENYSTRIAFVTQDDTPMRDIATIPVLKTMLKRCLHLKWGELLFWLKLKYFLPKRKTSIKSDEETACLYDVVEN